MTATYLIPTLTDRILSSDPVDRPAQLRSVLSPLDVDADRLDVLIPYLPALVDIGIDFSFIPLQEAIEGYVDNLEAACQAVIGYGGSLIRRNESFQSPYHATYCFIRALKDPWDPHDNWNKELKRIRRARYVSPYERALGLVYLLNRLDPTRNWDASVLDALSDELIAEVLLDDLQREVDLLTQS